MGQYHPDGGACLTSRPCTRHSHSTTRPFTINQKWPSMRQKCPNSCKSSKNSTHSSFLLCPFMITTHSLKLSLGRQQTLPRNKARNPRDPSSRTELPEPSHPMLDPMSGTSELYCQVSMSLIFQSILSDSLPSGMYCFPYQHCIYINLRSMRR